MTWSILARDSDGSFGVAIASRFFAVGALCIHTRHAVGALSTQALMNPLYGQAGIDRLAAGDAPQSVLDALTLADAGRDHRQLHLVGAQGEPAAFTGASCIDWCGHRIEADFSVAGNMLAGPRVIDETARAFRETAGTAAGGAAARGDGGRPGGRRRQARPAGCGAAHPCSGGLSRHSTCASTITRGPRRTGAALPQEPRALPVRSSPACRVAATRSGVTDRDEIERRIEAWIERPCARAWRLPRRTR